MQTSSRNREEKLIVSPVSEHNRCYAHARQTHNTSAASFNPKPQRSSVSLTACLCAGLTRSPQLGNDTSFDRVKPILCQEHVESLYIFRFCFTLSIRTICGETPVFIILIHFIQRGSTMTDENSLCTLRSEHAYSTVCSYCADDYTVLKKKWRDKTINSQHYIFHAFLYAIPNLSHFFHCTMQDCRTIGGVWISLRFVWAAGHINIA